MVAVAVWLLALSVFDLRERRLPNWLTLPGAVVIPAVAAVYGRGPAALAGAGALLVVYLVVHLVPPAALGAGDVKLAPGIGALTGAFGPDVWIVAALGASLLSAVWAVVLLARRSNSFVPHGVSMCISAALACGSATLLHT
ncbi:prepilin peptidase [Mycolicibacterium phlei]